MSLVVGLVESIELISDTNQVSSVMIGKHGQTMAMSSSPTIFSVDKQVVSFDPSFPIIAAAGDEIVVAGTIKSDGILHATAYENLTRAVGGNRVVSPAIMTLIYGGLIGLFLFFGWALAFLGQDEDAAIIVPVMLAGLAGTVWLGWFTRSFNRQMTNGAGELADYARKRLTDNSK